MNLDQDLTIEQAIAYAREYLDAQLHQADTTPETSASDIVSEIYMLLQHITNYSKATLIAHPETQLSATEKKQFLNYLARRDEGEPIAYITEQRAFWTLDLKVTKGVLIPRPDTELIIETALPLLKNNPHAHILDLGTGSGCIALALAREFPESHIIACDISATCIDIAKHNALTHNIHNVHFMRSHWFSEIHGKQFDLIVSNPPYISEDDAYIDEEVEAYEPDIALFSEQNGYADLFHIIENAPAFLRADATLILEHGFQQAETVRMHMRENGYTDIQSHCDLQLHERITCGNHRD